MRIAYAADADATEAQAWHTVTGVDEIDLVTLGHMPGGARFARANAVRDVDIRDLGDRASHVRVLAQTAVLVPGESVTVTAGADPSAIIDLVHDEIPGFCMVEYRENGPYQWRVVVTRVTC